MASGFNINVNVTPNMKDVQAKLNKSSKSLKINARLNLDMSQFEKQLKKINNKETGDLFKPISRSFKDVEYKGQQALKVVERFSDGVGHIKERTTYLKQVGDQFKVLGSEISKCSVALKPFEQAITSVTTQVDKVKGVVNEGGKDLNAVITTTTKTMEGESGVVQKLTTQVTQYTDELGRQVKVTTQLNGANGEVINTTKEIVNDEIALEEAERKATLASQQLAQQQQDLANKNKKVKQTFGDIIEKVAKFYLASLPIRAVQKVITETIQTVKEFDSALTEFRKVSSLSGGELDKYVDKLGELGSTVARTTTEMIQSATEFKKAGFTDEDSAKLAQISALYQNTADEILSASEASSVIISQMKAFNYTADEAIHILDTINQVSQDFAVSSGDIGKGLTQAGASLSTYGNEFEEVVGLVTAGKYFLPVTDLIDREGKLVTSFCIIYIICIIWKPNALHTNLSWRHR